MPRRSLLSAFVLATALLAPGAQVSADPYVTVTNCEMVQVQGVSADRLTLRILAKTGYTEWVRVYVGPYSLLGPDTCRVLEATAPAGWTASTTGSRDAGAIFNGPWSAGIPSGQALDGFQITLSRPTCCVHFVLGNALDTVGGTKVCFESCVATPAAGSTWGLVKWIYR